MSEILMLILIFVISSVVFYLCWHFLGKKGLFLFVTLATVEINFQAGKLLFIDSVPIIAGFGIYVLIFGGLLLMLEKYTLKDAKYYIVISVAMTVFSQILNALFFILWDEPLGLLSASFYLVGSVVSMVLVMILCMYLFQTLRNKMPFYLNCIINFVLFLLIDAFVFVCVSNIGSRNFMDMLQIAINNYWQKLIAAAITLGLLLLMQHFPKKPVTHINDVQNNLQGNLIDQSKK